jgi:hypothetical protein
MRAKIGKGLLTTVGLLTAIAPYLADWNETHIYNPNWPPHAKFHNGQTLAMGSLLGLGTLFFLWRPRGEPSTNLLAAGTLAALYWVSQMAAFLLPDVSYTDPEFVGPEGPAAVPPQVYMECVVLAVVAAGLYLVRPTARRTVRRP